MGKRLLALVLCALLGLSMLSACKRANNISSGAGDSDFPVAIGNVSISKEPSGAAVLSPNIASVILSIGYEITLKARSASCTQNDLSVLPEVTANDAKKIKELGADLVFADSVTDKQRSAMEAAGLTVLTLEPAKSREDLERLYAEVGSALKGAKTGYQKGSQVADGVFQTIDDISRVLPESDAPLTAVYLYDAKGAAATGDTLAGKLLEAAGLTNPAAGGKNGTFASAELLRADPRYLFCPTGVKAQLEASADYAKLTAVRQKRVYEMDPSLMKLQGGEIVEAVTALAGTVHPELLEKESASSGSGSSQGPQTAGSINLNQTLKSGMQTGDVMKMQKRLEELGYMFAKPTGLYAEVTVQAVKDFQYLNGMTVTGVADPETLKKMFSSGAVKRPAA